MNSRHTGARTLEVLLPSLLRHMWFNRFRLPAGPGSPQNPRVDTTSHVAREYPCCPVGPDELSGTAGESSAEMALLGDPSDRIPCLPSVMHHYRILRPMAWTLKMSPTAQTPCMPDPLWCRLLPLAPSVALSHGPPARPTSGPAAFSCSQRSKRRTHLTTSSHVDPVPLARHTIGGFCAHYLS